MRLLFVGMLVAGLSGVANAQSLSGTYAGESDGTPLTVQLEQGRDGRVAGALTGETETVRLSGQAQGGGRLVGTVQSDGQSFKFHGELRGDMLTLSAGTVTYTLQRVGAVVSPGKPVAERSREAVVSTQQAPEAGSRAVVVNGVRLSEEKVRGLEQTLHVRTQPGNYWYDKAWGVWGLKGGPIRGFLPAGMDLGGGKLHADASGQSQTGVFVNGRELHPLDVLALRQLGPVYTGRYWINAQGFYGLEGGPALGNLLNALAQQRQQGRQKEGILSTWDKTGVAVYDLR